MSSSDERVVFVIHHLQAPKYPLPRTPEATTFYVDSTKGSDSNPGTLQQPFKTIQKAVMIARSVEGPATILLRKGTFYLSDTIRLGPEDSYLTISNYMGLIVFFFAFFLFFFFLCSSSLKES